MTDTPDRNDDRVLAGEYVLGLLPPDEAAAFAARLAEEPALRALVREWSEDFARLAEEIEPETPPARVKAGIDARIFSGPSRGPLGLFRTLVVPLVTGAVLVVALVLSVGPAAPPVLPPAAPTYRADIAAEDRSLIVTAGYDAASAELFVERQQGAAPAGRVLELWLIAGDAAPVSLGVLPEEARARLPVPDRLQGRLPGGILAISDEPPGGSPTGAPTGDVLAVGPLTTL